ncbi:MAG: DUF2244 domain-containing protein [Hyphomicrobiales bacterium]|nr:DUF2244 domain-containing protein [Hyphomicrobiales bacterium]
MSDPHAADHKTFQATLLPHRSLSRKAFLLLMTLVCVVSFAAGAVFISIGAWPVTGFFGLDALLIYIAFRLNYRAGRTYEVIELRDGELKLSRVPVSGAPQTWRFNPYWVKVNLEESETTAPTLSLTSHGATLVFGAFLSADEKRGFAATLQAELDARRTAYA